MKQIFQYQKTGEIFIEDLPVPTLKNGGVLVKNVYSLISAGTEKSSVITAQASILGKAKSRPDLVKQVLDNIQREGLLPTYEKVKNRLDNYKELGYTSTGVVIESSVDEFKVGDRVACSGVGYAGHAEIVFVPKHLTVKLPENIDFKEGAFGTLGAIAMQGVRQANLKIGENVAVIGLGLLGQLTIQIVNASGCNAIGFDISEKSLEIAKKLGAGSVFKSVRNEVEGKIIEVTKGLGVDAVIITAGTLSNEPIETAGEILRDRGRVVIVGAIKADIPRKPYYDKEIDIRFSRSYGPGRYDTNYEEKGIDYPIGYVRFTEQRNVESFLSLIAKGSVKVKELISHTIPIEDGLRAYEILTGKIKEPFTGILISYPNNNNQIESPKVITNKKSKNVNSISKHLIGFIGAGNFAQSNLLPHLKNETLQMVCTTNPLNAKSVSEKFGFKEYTTSYEEILNSDKIDTVFIATRHNTHSKFVLEALNKGKNVFVEKPLALSKEELELIKEKYYEKLQSNKSIKLFVGYNRRFSEPFILIKDYFADTTEPFVINYRVNAGYFPPDSWYQDPEQGYRILSEGGHFIDIFNFITNESKPTKVFAQTINSNNKLVRNHDSVSVNISYADGSVCNLIYLANGSSKLDKEYCEIFSSGKTAVMNNFKEVLLLDKKKKKNKFNGSKGHKEEVLSFIKNIQSSDTEFIPFDSLYYTSLITFAILESISTGLPVEL
ncbi:MAG: bi-domain-containing oxidoreductase [Ignavibacterium sp.]